MAYSMYIHINALNLCDIYVSATIIMKVFHRETFFFFLDVRCNLCMHCAHRKVGDMYKSSIPQSIVHCFIAPLSNVSFHVFLRFDSLPIPTHGL